MNNTTPKSERLKRLLTIKTNDDSEGLIPFFDNAIIEFEALVVWRKI